MDFCDIVVCIRVLTVTRVLVSLSRLRLSRRKASANGG